MKLIRSLGLLDVFCIASGAMISSGLFILPALAYVQAGPAVVISYLLAALLAVTGMLSQAELVSAMPKAGGTYFYVSRSLGPAVGTIDGVVTWFSLSLKSAFALIGMAAFSRYILPEVDIRIIAIVLCLLFMCINMFGIKEAGKTQIVLVTGLILFLVIYIIYSLPAIQISQFESFTAQGARAIFATAGFVFVSYGGLLKVASIAEEVKQPDRVVPLGMILSLIIVSILYLLVVFITTGLGVLTDTDPSLTPISDGAAVSMGPVGKILLSIAAMLAFISTANAGIMAASRYLFSSSRDGLLPAWLSRINGKFGTPYIAILLTGLFMCGALFLDIPLLVKSASAVLILTYIFSCLSVIILRESRLQNYRPRFHSPLYPWIQIVGIIGLTILLFSMDFIALLLAISLIAIGFIIYWFYGRAQVTREYALMYLVERIVAKEITSHTLETELKEIIHERDEIVKDRFDYLVEKAAILDLPDSLDRDAFFEKASAALSAPLALSESQITAQLTEREQQSTTALTPFLAIPHIIVDGTHSFSLLIVRCSEGINFSDASPAVKAVFVLAGSLDERPFHLRALAALAGIVQDTEFETHWLAARDSASLRDILLLGKRRRYT